LIGIGIDLGILALIDREVLIEVFWVEQCQFCGQRQEGGV
jgi:hypothetical protein